MKEKIYSVSYYYPGNKVKSPSPFRFFNNIENAERVVGELNQKVSTTNIRYLVGTFRLEDF